MEKAFSVVHRDLCKLFWRKSFLFRDIVSDDGNEGRRVPLAAIGDGGQIGGVRLQQDPVRRRDGEGFADVVGFSERGHAVEGQHGAEVQPFSGFCASVRK